MTSEPKLKQNSFQFEATGTRWDIELLGEPGLSTDEKSVILKECEDYEAIFSRFKPESMVSSLKSGPIEVAFPEYATGMLELYENLERKSDGLVTPLIGQQLEQAGYDSRYTFVNAPLSEVGRWDDQVVRTGSIIKTSNAITLDFGAAGKGLLIDRLAQKLCELGHKDYRIDAGGDIRVSYLTKIGLENPLDEELIIGSVTLEKGALCASSGNRRAWKNFHHIIDPTQKKSPTDCIGTWAIAQTAMVADMVATALYLIEPNVLEEFQVEFMVLREDGHFIKTAGFNGDILQTNAQ